MNNVQLGKIGENTAVEILRTKGYKIMCRNYRCSQGEIDIIAVRGSCMNFIEVKLRTQHHYGRPCDAVGFDKQQHIRNAAKFYLKELERKGYVPRRVSFDVMEVMVEHIEEAF